MAHPRAPEVVSENKKPVEAGLKWRYHPRPGYRHRSIVLVAAFLNMPIHLGREDKEEGHIQYLNLSKSGACRDYSKPSRKTKSISLQTSARASREGLSPVEPSYPAKVASKKGEERI